MVRLSSIELQEDSDRQRTGKLLHFNILSQHIIVLNSLEACIELLETRGSKYAGRPSFTMLGEM